MEHVFTISLFCAKSTRKKNNRDLIFYLGDYKLSSKCNNIIQFLFYDCAISCQKSSQMQKLKNKSYLMPPKIKLNEF
jgi:hypothetical protein